MYAGSSVAHYENTADMKFHIAIFCLAAWSHTIDAGQQKGVDQDCQSPFKAWSQC